MGMSVLGCTTLLGACRQGEPVTPATEAGKEQPLGQLSEQNAREQAPRTEQDQAYVEKNYGLTNNR